MNDWTLLDSTFAVGHFQYENSRGDFALFTGSLVSIFFRPNFPVWEVEILLPPSAGKPILVITATGQLMAVDGWTIHTWQVSCLKLAMRGSGVGRVICSICLYLFNLSMGTLGGRCFIHVFGPLWGEGPVTIWCGLYSWLLSLCRSWFISKLFVKVHALHPPIVCIYIYIIYLILCHLSLQGLPIDRHCWLPHLHGIPFWDCRGWGERSSGDQGLPVVDTKWALGRGGACGAPEMDQTGDSRLTEAYEGYS